MSKYLTISEIRSAIVTALTDLLGTYTYVSGATTPAFFATDGSARVESQPRVTGLECVFGVDFVAPTYEELLGGQFYLTRRSTVTLKQFDTTSTVRGAMAVLIPALRAIPVRITDIGARVPRDTGLNNVETQTVTFEYQAPN